MRKKEYLILGIVVLVSLTLIGIIGFHPFGVGTKEKTSAPNPMQKGGIEDASAFMAVTINGTAYEPIPLTGDGVHTIRQKDTGAVNVIHVTKDSLWMESASCQGQDCVKQGVVSLANMHLRVLGNMVICLPNKVTLELIPKETVKDAPPLSDGADHPQNSN